MPADKGILLGVPDGSKVKNQQARKYMRENWLVWFFTFSLVLTWKIDPSPQPSSEPSSLNNKHRQRISDEMGGNKGGVLRAGVTQNETFVGNS